MMADRQRLADTQHPVEADGSVRPSQTVTQRSGHSLERKKEPADMELSPPRRKRNAAGFFCRRDAQSAETFRVVGSDATDS